MKRKVLFTASVSGHIRAFHLPYLKWFQTMGFETHVACRNAVGLDFVDKHWEIPFVRNPFAMENIVAYKKLKGVIEENDFALINCHTPVASFLTRLVSNSARINGTKLIYSAHGFHFFKGASWLYWLLYYPVEVLLSHITDAIVCINKEDFTRIKKRGSQTCRYYLIPGIGVSKERFFPVEKCEKAKLRAQNNLDVNSFSIIYAAEFTDRKNHQFIINAIRENLPSLDDDIQFYFAGKGEKEEQIREMVRKNNLEHKIRFLGFRRDIDQVYKMADIGVSSSRQEGMGLNLVEEMMCGLPVVATKIRGHDEVIDDQCNGLFFTQGNSSQFIDHILSLKKDKILYQRLSENALKKAANFELGSALECMTSIYCEHLQAAISNPLLTLDR